MMIEWVGGILGVYIPIYLLVAGHCFLEAFVLAREVDRSVVIDF